MNSANPNEEIEEIKRVFGSDRFENIRESGKQGGFHKVFFANEYGLELVIKKVVISQEMYETCKQKGFKGTLDDLAKKEIEIIKQRLNLSHQNILPIHEFHEFKEVDNKLYFIEDRFEKTLEELLSDRKCLTVEESIDYFRQIIEGLACCHSYHKNKKEVDEPVLHRDLKAHNIGIHNNIIKLFDFGTSPYFDDVGKGKTSYPEDKSPSVLNTGKYEMKDDVYSAALLFYKMITGKPLYSHGMKIPENTSEKERAAEVVLKQQKDRKHFLKAKKEMHSRLKRYVGGKYYLDIFEKCILQKYKDAIAVKKDIDSIPHRRLRKKIGFVIGALAASALAGYSFQPLLDHYSILKQVKKENHSEAQVRDILALIAKNDGNYIDALLVDNQLKLLDKSIRNSKQYEKALCIPKGQDSVTIEPSRHWKNIEFTTVESKLNLKLPYYEDDQGPKYALIRNSKYIIGVPVFLEQGLYDIEVVAAVHRWFFDNWEMDPKKAGPNHNTPETLIIKLGDNPFIEGKVTALDSGYRKGNQFFNFPAEPENTTVRNNKPIKITENGFYLLTIRNRINEAALEGLQYCDKDMLVGPITIKKHIIPLGKSPIQK